MEKVFEIYIKTTPERLWEAITDPEQRAKFNFGVGVKSDWTNGSPYHSVHDRADAAIAEGENLEVDPPRRLVQSMTALWSEDVKAEGTSRVTWEIDSSVATGARKLRVVLDTAAATGQAIKSCDPALTADPRSCP